MTSFAAKNFQNPHSFVSNGGWKSNTGNAFLSNGFASNAIQSIAPIPSLLASRQVPPGSHFNYPPNGKVQLPFNAPPFSHSVPLVNPQPSDLYTWDNVTVDDKLLALSGPYFTLSNYYVAPIFMKNKRYRSVEHYVFEKFFKSLKLPQKHLEKVSTTTDPLKLPSIAAKYVPKQRLWPLNEDQKQMMLKWYERAMRKKLRTYDVIRRTLLETGNALLIETNNCLLDTVMSCGMSEVQVQFLLTRIEISPLILLQTFSDQTDEMPDRTKALIDRLGENQTGVILMRLRAMLQKVEPSNKFFLAPQPRMPFFASQDVMSLDHIRCFSDDSVLHPRFACPFNVDDDPYVLYNSVSHYVYVQAAKFFCFPSKSVENLFASSANDIRRAFFAELSQRFPDPARWRDWFENQYERVLLDGCRAKMTRHPVLARCLLDTGRSLLVYCHRFTSSDAEFSVGMRESELKEWMRLMGMKIADLASLMSLDFAHRPPFLGGNRLGFLLMGLRIELSVIPVMELPQPLPNEEVVFGEASGLETGDDFDTHTTESKYLLWPSPLVLHNRKQGVRTWYPKKRRLPGFYPDGMDLEAKRQTQPPAHVRLHPDYTMPRIQSINYPIPIDSLNSTHVTDQSLVDLVQDLVNKVREQQETLKCHESELSYLNDDIMEQNFYELKVGPMIQMLNSLKQNPDNHNIMLNGGKIKPTVYNNSNQTISIDVLDTSSTSNNGQQKLTDVEKLYKTQMDAVKSGFRKYFEQKCIEKSGENQSIVLDDSKKWKEEGQVQSSVFDSTIINVDESQLNSVVGQLYKHLDESGRAGASYWLQHAVKRVTEFRSMVETEAKAANDTDLLKFVGTVGDSTSLKPNFTISKPLILENDDDIDNEADIEAEAEPEEEADQKETDQIILDEKDENLDNELACFLGSL